MIHLNKGEGKPHEWITEEEFAKRHPELSKELNKPIDENAHGQKLKALRIKKRLTLREFSKRTGFSPSEVCDYERGRKEITAEINDKYCMGLNS